MIRNENQYKSTVALLTERHLQLADRREELRLKGLSDEQIGQMIGNLISNCRHLEEEIATYERSTAGTWVPV
ncbi:MAG TPA: hypothetical protein VGM05_08775 [Planctomycetaceae bacterium]|jgi:hypothetical protein